MGFKFSQRIRNSQTVVTVANDEASYNELVSALIRKYGSVRITSGGAYSKVTGVLQGEQK